MPIADKLYFSRENIENCRFNASSVLAEQAVHCLELVAELVETGLNFQFKGGNSLLLVLGEPQRFSIDVDIASDQSREEIENVLNKLISQFGVFTRWERRQHKTKPWIPLSSYYLYYNSLFDPSPDVNIMLDVQMRRSAYRTEFREVICGTLYKSSTKCELPLPSSIISDKLLTLGPSTLGIPVGRGKEAQRLKHVYDVSRLLGTEPDVDMMRESFASCLKQENELQGTSHEVKAIVKDTLSFLWSTAAHENKPELTGAPVLDENIKGLEPFSKHLFESGYSWQNLQRDMARAALCISAVGNDSITNDMLHAQFDINKTASDSQLPLKIANPHARFCWEAVYKWWNSETFWI